MGKRVTKQGGSSTWSLAGACLTLAFGFVVVGCGHPASRAECEEILDKSAAIELAAQNVTDPAEVQKRTTKARVDRGDELVKNCVGRRITQSALECVRKATTNEQVDRCLD